MNRGIIRNEQRRYSVWAAVSVVSGRGHLPKVALLPPLPYLARMFTSPISTHEVLWTMRSMMPSAWMPPPSLSCQSFCWNCVQKIVGPP